MADPRLLALLGDKRVRCFIQVLKGGECEMLKVDRDKLMAGDEQEKEKIYRFLPEFDKIRKQGYDLVGKLVELVNRLQSEKVTDLAVAVGVMANVMFGRQISEEDAKKIGAVIDAFRCIGFDEDGIGVDNECLEGVNVPDQLKDQIRMVSVANLLW